MHTEFCGGKPVTKGNFRIREQSTEMEQDYQRVNRFQII